MALWLRLASTTSRGRHHHHHSLLKSSLSGARSSSSVKGPIKRTMIAAVVVVASPPPRCVTNNMAASSSIVAAAEQQKRTMTTSSDPANNNAMLPKSGKSLFISKSTDVEMIAANHRQNSSGILSSSQRSMSTTATATTASTTAARTASASASVLTNSLNNSSSSSSSSSTFSSRMASTEASSSSVSETTTDASTTPATATATATLKDEYGTMDDSGDSYIVENFVLESGQVLEEAQLRYQTYGTLNETTRDNVIVVCHALTGNASLHSWWGDLLGPGRAFDTDRYYIVCCNILGSCYGSTSPISMKPNTADGSSNSEQQRYGMDFPEISVKDTVRLQLLLLQNHLNVSSIKSVIGGSFGGMQALEFACQAGHVTGDFFRRTESATADDDDDNTEPFVRTVIPIACGAQHTAWQIAISEVQRQAIYKDVNWQNGDPFQATNGLQVARQMGMISYRTPIGYSDKFGRHLQQQQTQQPAATGDGDSSSNQQQQQQHLLYGSQANWRVKSYLEYQGEKFLSRFDPVTYVKLTEQMDSHDITRGRVCSSSNDGNDGGDDDAVAAVLAGVQIPALVLGIDSDVLYPLREQEELAHHLPQATLGIIHSDDGHDGFLLEQEQVSKYISEFLAKHD